MAKNGLVLKRQDIQKMNAPKTALLFIFSLKPTCQSADVVYYIVADYYNKMLETWYFTSTNGTKHFGPFFWWLEGLSTMALAFRWGPLWLWFNKQREIQAGAEGAHI